MNATDIQNNKHFFHLINELYNNTNWWFKTYRVWEDIPNKSKILKVFSFLRAIFILTVKFCKWFWRFYKISVKFIDKHFSLNLKLTLDTLGQIFSFLSNKVEVYNKKSKYSMYDQFEKKYTETDIAYMAIWMGEWWKVTIKHIQSRFDLSYHYALEVKQMMKEKLKALNLITENERKERENVNIDN